MKAALVATLALAIALTASCNNNNADKPGTGTTQQASLPEQGKAIFMQNCTTCHLKNTAVSGPAVAGVLGRWNNDTAHLKAFIRNPSKLISEGFPAAVAASQKANGAMMTPWPNLSDEELNALIAYMESPAID
jgi:cytochrome c2